MVGILWNARKYHAAIRLEQFWNKILEQEPISLYCAYTVDPLSSTPGVERMPEIECAHTHLIPPAAGQAEAVPIRITKARGILSLPSMLDLEKAEL